MKKFIIKTFGCKTNQSESAIIEEKMIKAGYMPVQNIEDCDYYIFNSCSVTEEADKKLLRAICSVKKKNPEIKIVVTGCYAQLNPNSDNKHIDKIVGNAEKFDIPEIISAGGKSFVTDIFAQKTFRYERIEHIKKTRATIKIQDGCNNRCAYCTICKARGKSRSCNRELIIEQIKSLSEVGYNEIILTGIHVGQWGGDLKERSSLSELIKAIKKGTNIKTLRIGSLDPSELSDEFIETAAGENIVCPHFHISLQSANEKTLKQMNRGYDFERIKHVTEELNKKFKNPFIGCDIIVGFPGESEEDFELTYQRLKSLKLSQIHVFPFSSRRGTPAADMPNMTDEKTKHERVMKIKLLSENKHIEFLKKNIGSTYELTVERNPDKATGLYKGVTPNYIKVIFEGTSEIRNKLVNVMLMDISDDRNTMRGKIF